MKEVNLRISRTKNKILLYFPKKIREELHIKKGCLIKINFEKEQTCLITKFNRIITLKKRTDFNLLDKKEIKVGVEKFIPLKNPRKIFFNNRIDLAFFIPKFTRKKSSIYFEKIKINNNNFLHIFSVHSRGSSKQFLLRRFIEPNIFGKLLGQLQAEGTKTNYDVIEFCNKNLLELKDFTKFLKELGINQESISVKLDYNYFFEDKLSEIINEFKNFVNLDVNYISGSSKGTKGYGFKIIVRNTALSEIILNALTFMRKYIEKVNWNKNLLSFSEGYLSKILCGDGTFELTSKNRKRWQSRVKIYDGNPDYLNHYAKILKKFGFTPYVHEKSIFVRALCNLNLAKRLLEIGAFETNENWRRIKIFIENIEATST